jgi:hypothetical protein
LECGENRRFGLFFEQGRNARILAYGKLPPAARPKKGKRMKKAKASDKKDDLQPEYDLSQLKGRVRGKYLARYRAGTNLALPAPEVRAAFPTDDAVNQALRSVLQAQHRP